AGGRAPAVARSRPWSPLVASRSLGVARRAPGTERSPFHRLTHRLRGTKEEIFVRPRRVGVRQVPHDTSRGRTSPHPARPSARSGRAGRALSGRPGRPGTARPVAPRPPQGRPHAAGDAEVPRFRHVVGADAEGSPLQRVVEEHGPLPAPKLRRAAAPGAAGPGPAARRPAPPPSLAPEQIEGEPVGRPADVFAWGATVVSAATGRPPFGTGPRAEVVRRVTSRRPDLGDLSGPLRELAARCLDKNPAARPTAPQVVRALREGQGPMPKPRPTRIPRYRWRMMLALAAVVVCGFVLGMLY